MAYLKRSRFYNFSDKKNTILMTYSNKNDRIEFLEQF